MPTSPLASTGNVTSYRVLLGGIDLAPEAPVIEIEVQHALGEVPRARIVLMDGDMPTGDWPLADSGAFLPGTAVEIFAGYDAVSSTIFKGVIARMGVGISGPNRSQLTLECRDCAVADAAPESQAPATATEAALKLTWGVDLQAFEAELLAGKSPDQSTASTRRVRGTARFQGSALAVAGGMIELAGVGKWFSGTQPVNRVWHRLSEGDWTTEVAFGLPQPHLTRALVLNEEDGSLLLKDAYGNQIQMDASGIRIESSKDLVLNAVANLQASALNINCTAQVGFTGKGSATAELSASGQTTVKGAMVLIN
ncbi:MAG: hypothetical protein CFE46_14735 [Burkholderiales bacterium PBB6]|nr:MAG: hypothetical protein CFE46_14735 [Burkholderiales bacterium PBB6]